MFSLGKKNKNSCTCTVNEVLSYTLIISYIIFVIFGVLASVIYINDRKKKNYNSSFLRKNLKLNDKLRLTNIYYNNNDSESSGYL